MLTKYQLLSIAISINNKKLYLIEIGPNFNGSVVNSENKLWKILEEIQNVTEKKKNWKKIEKKRKKIENEKSK